MKPFVRGVAALLATLAMSVCTAQHAAAQVQVAPLTQRPHLAAPVRPVKGGPGVYIVKLKDPGAATYHGERAGYAATQPGPGQRMHAQSATVESYVQHLEQTHDALLGSVGAAGDKLYDYRYVLNGFAAKLTPAQASKLAQRGEVERIWPDTDQHIQTNNSAIFLGLEDQQGGLRADLKLRGENVVVGIIDSGVAPHHPSLLDTEERIPRTCRSQWATASWLGLILCGGYRRHPPLEIVYDAPVGFSGACETGEGFQQSDCNNKVVGARYYLDGFLFRHELDAHEFRSPHDADGHGTHVATIVAGNAVDATLLGTRVAHVSGIAPRARVAIYKACWVIAGDVHSTCATSDLARAIDDAVADGVDIINYSVGSLETDLTAPDDIALLNAFDAGVLTVVAAGNDGPNLGTIGSPSSDPWVLTVAASSQTGNFFDDGIEITAPADLAGTISMREASFTPALPHANKNAIEETLIAADDGQAQLDDGSSGTARDACQPLVNGTTLEGHIALIERGGCEFQVKIANAERAGAVAVVVYNNSGAPTVMNGDAGSVGIPAVMIDTADGQRLLDRLAAGDAVKLKLAEGIFVTVGEDGNVMADFSSRGPNLSDANLLKPDVTAPGVDILAGDTPDVANGLRGETYQYLSGTSQAAPEVAGVAALLKEAHPDWSPAALKSALMTTAYQSVTRSDGAAADPLDMGAGHIDANHAIDPGLVYETTFRDHAAYLCGLRQPPFPADQCAGYAAAGLPSDPTNLNLPSVSLVELITGDTVTRRVTNYGPPSSFHAEVQPPPDVDVFIDPPTLALDTGQAGTFSLRFVDRGAAIDQWQFGQLRWLDATGTRTAVSPIALQPVALRVAPEIFLSGGSGQTSLPVAFGYTGAYGAAVHGLHAPFRDANGELPRGFVDDDATRTFSFRFDRGVTAHTINVPANQLYLRVALFDEFTDGADDLDLYLYYCPNNQCTQVGQSGSLTSNEQIDLAFPEPGNYLALVHGFQTDQAAGGPGANYTLFTWSFGSDDDAGNLTVTAPQSVAAGDHLDLPVSWSQLAAGERYIGGISHTTPDGLYSLTIVNVQSP